MKSAAFEYHAPTDRAGVVELLAELGDDAKVIAGGQSLIPLMALRLASFPHLIDLGRVPELRGVRRDNGTLRVGAMTTQATVERNTDAVAAVPLLGRALPLIGHYQIRNRGTIGGSIAHADPASELPAVALALDAELEVASATGTRTVAAAQFFEGTWTTALEPTEILAAVRFPVWSGACGFAVEEVARRHGDFAIAGVAAGVELDGSTVRRAAVAMFGMGATPVRAAAAERAFESGASADEAGLVAVEGLDPPGDLHASTEYRRHVGARLVARALRSAVEDAAHD